MDYSALLAAVDSSRLLIAMSAIFALIVLPKFTLLVFNLVMSLIPKVDPADTSSSGSSGSSGSFAALGFGLLVSRCT